jgi:hypothetical protein
MGFPNGRRNVTIAALHTGSNLASERHEGLKAIPCERPPRPSHQSHVIFCGGDVRALELLWPEEKRET